ncbi:MAG: biotin/lipoyl-binding protein [Bacteroidales bacterium]|nr:biotin/lipoyl-binding protein [Bacteroidales bacterium]
MKNYSFTINGNDYEVEIIDYEGDIAILEVNGTPYKVEVHRKIQQTKTPTLIRQEVLTTRKESKIKKTISSGYTPIKAPLPGNVLQLFVNVGDEVKKGEKLMMYEAMKMENMILSEKDGVIKTIKVNLGDSFLQGDTLIEIA